ncbi:MAG: cytochrome c oxidase accessory protein CcoG [Melioribacteraceae bacterium]|nr:cytochrome c oxidase accessory protein CcoG [Melioribacteraceae bacterium]MCF8263344.1 cytochrome c oxidase accessory protein CcoG [Melioribacteraceae bacterium]MCF8414079.1 cytochrome c oxidase accessory protein CcoG [Melioribacteraceae bacterium]
MSENFDNDGSFRDSLSTVTEDGKRVWVYPKKPSGRFYSARKILSYFLLAFLFLAPLIKIDGRPLMLLNILERKFIIFGIPFGPHDFHLFVLAMIATIVGIFLFTVVYGRIFCGWICPQTIFMELLFRRIEYFIEGDANKQRALNKAPWNGSKYFKKISKHVIFFGISFLIANTFLAWIIGIDELITIVTAPPSQHLGGLFAITVFSFAFYFVFSSFREQVCTLICPYGRLQGVMLDQNSIVIAYDYERGEPRGKLKRGEARTENGDCIDCHLCVDVCPTGIDIRNGTQLECINCTACIDACDAVMDKIDKPRGLIRYASKNEIETKIRKIFTPRAISYTFILFLLIGIFSFLFATRSDIELRIFRTPGVLYQEQPDDKISNLYDVEITNKTFDNFSAELKLTNIAGEIKLIGTDLKVAPHGEADGKFMIVLDKHEINKLLTPINIEVKANGKVIEIIKTTFLGKFDRKETQK